MTDFVRWQSASGMGDKAGQAAMQPINSDMITIGKLVEQPKNAVHIDLLCNSQFAECAIAG